MNPYELVFMGMLIIWGLTLINHVSIPKWMEWLFIIAIGLFLGVYAPMQL